MADQFDVIPKPTGANFTSDPRHLSTMDWLVVGICVIWVIATISVLLIFGGAIGADTSPLQIIAIGGTIFLPVALTIMILTASRSIRLMRAESQGLQSIVEQLRFSVEEEARHRKVGLQPSVEKKLDEIASAARLAETAVATFTSRRTLPPPIPTPLAHSDPHQADLELGLDTHITDVEISNEDLIRALDFPETADDTAGFAALRRALADRKSSQVIQASQDILTLFAEDGIYMDDLRPDRARPDLWRRFSTGDRGAMITALGGIRDRSSLALTAGRMRQDAVFRDTGHHFLRHFDTMFQAFEPNATDSEIAALTNTRSAKAFMLLGRVNGIFD
ncbi:MAG: hypothetical protein ACPGRD_00310 [Planktomarina sp.]